MKFPVRYFLIFLFVAGFYQGKSQNLDIDSYSYKQYFMKDGELKESADTVKVIINNTTFVKGKDVFKVVAIIQSKVRENKYRIYYLKPKSSGDFEFDIEKVDFDTRYNELKVILSPTTVYGLYVK